MQIKGITAHPGQAHGVARVITNVEQLDSIQQGEILVCRMTTPEWVHVFDKLSALVTEEGGTLCHAAIVARNYGKPCIVAATGIMSKVKDGDKISVMSNGGANAVVLVGEEAGTPTKEETQTAADIAKFGSIGGHRLSMKELEYYN